MAIEFELNGSAGASARFLTYAHSPARLRQTGGAAPLNVTVSSVRATSTGGEAVFYTRPGTPSQSTLTLTLPANGAWIDFAVGGKWEAASADRDDCHIVVASATGRDTFPCMIRLRKNANGLTARERDRFVRALARLNSTGTYQAFRNVHVGGDADLQEHRGPHFLPWHRAYLLDFERALQAIDPEVTLPYWKFDEKAPNLFSERFLGATKQVPSAASGTVPVAKFANGHPLAAWVIDTIPGIRRGAAFDTLTEAAPGAPNPDPRFDFPLLNEAATLALGDVFEDFRAMEASPHGAAHVSFLGPINNITTAPRDPLFFLLHCNVDRLWALWQWLKRHRLSADVDAYEQDNAAAKGRKLQDTLWPWDGDTKNGRPTFPPPRVGMPPSGCTPAPGVQPVLGAMIDADGLASINDRLGFGYDTVPFEED